MSQNGSMEMLRINICDVMKIGNMDVMFEMMEMGTALFLCPLIM